MSKQGNKTIIYKETIINLLLHMLNTAAHGLKQSETFEIEYRKRLGFQREVDWKKYRACVDLIVDTEYAIHSAFRFQLGDLSKKKKDIGELYIRLYGILNAVYLQMNALESIAKLLNFPDRDQVGMNFRKLRIYKLRGMAASHTNEYLVDQDDLIPKTSKTTSFRIVQCELEETGKHIRVLDENNVSITFNLLQELTEYESLAKTLLVMLIEHSIKTRYPDREHRNGLKAALKENLSNLIDYSTVDQNKAYEQKLEKKHGKMIGVFDLSKEEDFDRAIRTFTSGKTT